MLTGREGTDLEILLAIVALLVAVLAHRSARDARKATEALRQEVQRLRRQLAEAGPGAVAAPGAGSQAPGAMPPMQGTGIPAQAAGASGAGNPAQGAEILSPGAGAPDLRTGLPVWRSGVPAGETGVPAQETRTPVPGTGMPVHGMDVPAQGAASPVPRSGVPAQGTGVPVAGTAVPAGAGAAARTAGPAASLPAPPAAPGAPPRSAAPPAAWTNPSPSLEERLGARLPVWIGSIALALAGAFLVKHSVDQGWFSPPVRVGLGVAFGVFMLLAGEWLRRSSARVSQGLSAAGIADLFACLLAAVQLYELIPPAAGFALMAATTALAVALSLRQGPMVAVIGLVGGFLAPAWIRVGEPDARNLFGYLLLLETGLLAVSRRRGWPGVAMLATGASLLWVLAWLAGPVRPADAVWLDLFLIATAGAAAASVLGGGTPWAGRTGSALLAGGTSVLALLAAAQLARQTGNSPVEWVSFGLLAAGLMVLGRIDGTLAGLAWVAAGVGGAMLLGWSSAGADDPRRLLVTTLALGALFAAGGYLAAVVLPRRGAPRPGLWTALSAASAVAYFLIAFATSETRPLGVRWGAVAVGLGGLYAMAAVDFWRRRERPAVERVVGAEDVSAPAVRGTSRPPAAADSPWAWAAVPASRWAPAGDAPLAAAAVAATTFASLAVPIELERAWLSMAWALEVPVLARLAGRFRVPALTVLARALAVLAVLRLAGNPAVLDYPIGQGVVWNWLLLGYGVPLLALGAGAWLARRQGDRTSAGLFELGGLALALAYVTLEIGQIYHPGEPDGTPVPLSQWGSWTVAWLALGWGALAAGRRTGRNALAAGGLALTWLGLVATFFAQWMLVSPLDSHVPVGGTPIWNLLLWIYGAPAALLIAAAREAARWTGGIRDNAGMAGTGLADLAGAIARLSSMIWRVAALGLAFTLVSTEVRQLFHGSYLDGDETSIAERWAYSVAWALFATVLLALGIARRGRLLRYSSLAVMTVVVLKVFLYDTAHLTGLYRVGSLLGLGAVLLLLAHLYGRFVFREPAREPVGEQEREPAQGAGREPGREDTG